MAVYRTDGLLPMIPPESLERRKRRCQIAASTHRNPTSPVGILGIRMRQAPRSRGYITVTSLAHAGHSRKPPRRTLRDSSRDSWRRPSPPPPPPPPSSFSSPAETRQCFVLSLAEFNYKEEAETLRPAVHRIGQKIEATLPLCFLLLCRLLSPFQPTLKFPLLNLPPPPSIPKMDSHLPSIPEASRKHPGSILEASWKHPGQKEEEDRKILMAT